MRPLLLSIVATFGVFPQQNTEECRIPISEVRFERSDVVVEGRAYCLVIEDQCEILIDRVLKGDVDEIGTRLTIEVDDPPPDPNGKGYIVVGRCPQTFEPWAHEIDGRFYLTGRLPSRLYGAFPPDRRGTETREDQ